MTVPKHAVETIRTALRVAADAVASARAELDSATVGEGVLYGTRSKLCMALGLDLNASGIAIVDAARDPGRDGSRDRGGRDPKVRGDRPMTTRRKDRSDDAELVGAGCGCAALMIVALIKLAFWVAVITIAIRLLVGCGPAPVCPTLATRCAGERVEICDSSGQWFTVADCGDLEHTSGGLWACGETHEDGEQINACLPELP